MAGRGSQETRDPRTGKDASGSPKGEVRTLSFCSRAASRLNPSRMAQYNPLFKALDHPELSRRITREEYQRVVQKAKEEGLTNLDVQGYRWLR